MDSRNCFYGHDRQVANKPEGLEQSRVVSTSSLLRFLPTEIGWLVFYCVAMLVATAAFLWVRIDWPVRSYYKNLGCLLIIAAALPILAPWKRLFRTKTRLVILLLTTVASSVAIVWGSTFNCRLDQRSLISYSPNWDLQVFTVVVAVFVVVLKLLATLLGMCCVEDKILPARVHSVGVALTVSIAGLLAYVSQYFAAGSRSGTLAQILAAEVTYVFFLVMLPFWVALNLRDKVVFGYATGLFALGLIGRGEYIPTVISPPGSLHGMVVFAVVFFGFLLPMRLTVLGLGSSQSQQLEQVVLT